MNRNQPYIQTSTDPIYVGRSPKCLCSRRNAHLTSALLEWTRHRQYLETGSSRARLTPSGRLDRPDSPLHKDIGLHVVQLKIPRRPYGRYIYGSPSAVVLRAPAGGLVSLSPKVSLRDSWSLNYMLTGTL